ncbi:10343_t:CDS:2, partial [Dentiscutata heterogama]
SIKAMSAEMDDSTEYGCGDLYEADIPNFNNSASTSPVLINNEANKTNSKSISKTSNRATSETADKV